MYNSINFPLKCLNFLSFDISLKILYNIFQPKHILVVWLFWWLFQIIDHYEYSLIRCTNFLLILSFCVTIFFSEHQHSQITHETDMVIMNVSNFCNSNNVIFDSNWTELFMLKNCIFSTDCTKREIASSK